MSGFDIEGLLKFQPARYYCVKCLALTGEISTKPSGPGTIRNRDGRLECSVCQLEYVPTSSYSRSAVASYLADMSCHIKSVADLNHARQLARIGSDVRRGDPHYPPVRGLLEALSRARDFAHFTTFNMSRVMVGALKVTAQRISVRGAVSAIDSALLAELVDYREEAPGLSVKAYDSDPDETKRIHENMIVIDGLLAFKGPANLTMSEWRKAAYQYPDREGGGSTSKSETVVTDVEEVIALHNSNFSPRWARMSMIGDKITMDFPR
ncbi:MAG: phospholipase D family protein [Blastocatellia bacterium]|nr:phospholipase D family protein [Blastocatellia bacterium]